MCKEHNRACTVSYRGISKDVFVFPLRFVRQTFSTGPILHPFTLPPPPPLFDPFSTPFRRLFLRATSTNA